MHGAQLRVGETIKLFNFVQTVEIGRGSSHHAGDLWYGRWEMWRELVIFYWN